MIEKMNRHNRSMGGIWPQWCRGLSVFAMAIMALTAIADDTVGYLRVQVATNAITAVAMPFEPLMTNSPAGFLVGPFTENDIGESDELLVLGGSYGTVSNAVWSAGGWRTPIDDVPSSLTAVPGDTIVLRTVPSADFSIYVFGRVPNASVLTSWLPPGINFAAYGYPAAAFPTSSLPAGVMVTDGLVTSLLTPLWANPVMVSNSTTEVVSWHRSRPYSADIAGAPNFEGMNINIDADEVTLTVAGSGPTDVLRLVDSAGVVDEPVWSHCARVLAPASCYDNLTSKSAVFYRVADAERDTDGDGLSDVLETQVYGTSPSVADTDGDGMLDAFEIGCGLDPLVPAERFGFAFVENFDLPVVTTGELDGQHGWQVNLPMAAMVGTNLTFNGNGALELKLPPDLTAGDDVPIIEASHVVTGAPSVVWLDMRTYNHYGGSIPDATGAAAAFAFDNHGHPVMTSGAAMITNTAYAATESTWVRCTARLDYTNGTWDFYVNGFRVGMGLVLNSFADRLTAITASGESRGLDAVKLSAIRPEGLSDDGDELPDEWEMVHFGNLNCDGTGDADGDGLVDGEEFRLGTDPYVVDTDGDGLPDGWEVFYGLNPLHGDDNDDPDKDGRNNAVEYAQGTDPQAFEPDPTVAQMGLRAEFRATSGTLATLPDFAALPFPFALSVSTVINYPSQPWLANGGKMVKDHFAARFDGFLRVEVAGDYMLYLTSDEGARLWIDGLSVINDATAHRSRTRNVSMYLDKGCHPLMLDYYENTSSEALRLEWQPPSGDRIVIPATAFCHLPRNLSPQLMVVPSAPHYIEGESVSVVASATDIDGEVVRLAVYVNGQCLDEVEGVAEAELMLAGLEVGVHQLETVAYDDAGAATTNIIMAEVRPLPPGYELGLQVSYSQLEGAITRLPDFSNLIVNATGVLSTVSLPADVVPWPGAPADCTNHFAATIDGALWVPETGGYQFAIASDDGSRLWLDGKIVIENDLTHSMTEKSATLILPAGMHTLLIEYFNASGKLGLSLKWAQEDTELELVPARVLYHHGATTDDTDGDTLPDWWELLYGLVPQDGTDAVRDDDGDGLTNLEEFRRWTNPRQADTDGDGMPDGWEVANGFVPYLDDSLGDGDNDGLVNADEYRAGTSPSLADTDGDGCGDYQEVRNLHSNPLVVDVVWPPIQSGEVLTHSIPISSTGTWRFDLEGNIYAAERAGSLTWELTVPVEGADAIAISLSQHEMFSKATDFDLSLFVDGIFVCRQIVSAPYGHPNEGYFFFPEINAGIHSFRLVWHNWEVNTFLAIHSLRFVKFGGPDANGNGIPDWRDFRNHNASGLNEFPLESLVSPLCVEGHDLWRDVLELGAEYEVGNSNAAFTVIKTIGDGFYADISLAQEGRTRIAMLDRGISNFYDVVWSELDVFAEQYITNALVIRAGDSLRLSGNGSVVVFEAETADWRPVTNWIQTVATAYSFESSGSYLVMVTEADILGGERVGYALVEVVASKFSKRNLAIMIDDRAMLRCPELSSRNLLEHDAALQVDAESADVGGVDLVLMTHTDRNLGLVSRISEGGPISDAIQVVPVWADNGTYYHVVQTYPDGSQLVEVSLLLGACAENMSVALEIFVSGVTFEDGTRTKILTADDFDENGHYVINFIKARGVTTSVCHRTYIYQEGKLIYTNK